MIPSKFVPFICPEKACSWPPAEEMWPAAAVRLRAAAIRLSSSPYQWAPASRRSVAAPWRSLTVLRFLNFP